MGGGREGGRGRVKAKERERDIYISVGAPRTALRPGRAAACALTRQLPLAAVCLLRTGRTAAVCTLRVARRRPLEVPSLILRPRIRCRFLPVVSLPRPPRPPFPPLSRAGTATFKILSKGSIERIRRNPLPTLRAPPAASGRNDTASNLPLTAAVAGCRNRLGLLRLAPGRRLHLRPGRERLLQVPSSSSTALGARAPLRHCRGGPGRDGRFESLDSALLRTTSFPQRLGPH